MKKLFKVVALLSSCFLTTSCNETAHYYCTGWYDNGRNYCAGWQRGIPNPNDSTLKKATQIETTIISESKGHIHYVIWY